MSSADLKALGPERMPKRILSSPATGRCSACRRSWPHHVIEVGRHERGLESKGMGRDGCVEILNARPTAFQGRLELAVVGS